MHMVYFIKYYNYCNMLICKKSVNPIPFLTQQDGEANLLGRRVENMES